MSAVALAFAALTLLLFFLSFSASAQAPTPPQTFVMETRSVVNYASGSSSQEINVTWTISPEDTDQTNGAFTYSLYVRCPSLDGGGSPYYARLNLTDAAISARPGWLQRSTPLSLGTPFCGLGTLDFNMTAWNGTFQSSPSCGVNITADRMESSSIFFGNKSITNHGQCGSNITRAPTGIASQVQAFANSTQNGRLRLKWPVSTSDVNLTVGNFTYRVRGFEAFEFLNETDPTTGIDANGLRQQDVTLFDNASLNVKFQAAAWDPSTRMRSNWTCAVGITTIYGETNVCGNVETFSPLNSLVGSGTVLFPWVAPAALATDWGLAQDLAPWFFGFIWIAIITGIGFWLANGPGMVVGGLVGLGSAGLFGLIPLWLIILIFALLAAVAIMLFRGSETA